MSCEYKRPRSTNTNPVNKENIRLYLPVQLGERDEIDADGCTLERQRLKRKPAA